MAVPALHRKRTYEDYRRTPDDERYELLDGELIRVPTPRVDHQRVVVKLASLLHEFVWERGLGEVLLAPCDVVLSDTDVVQPDGANLRESALTREQLVFVIKCGLPGRSMPAYDRRAYVDDRCLGRTRADLDRMGLQLFDPPATLQNREVERLADFLLAKVVGQGPMDRQKCIDFWGEEAAVCRTEFPD